jgi:hypothetical protein
MKKSKHIYGVQSKQIMGDKLEYFSTRKKAQNYFDYLVENYSLEDKEELTTYIDLLVNNRYNGNIILRLYLIHLDIV